MPTSPDQPVIQRWVKRLVYIDPTQPKTTNPPKDSDELVVYDVHDLIQMERQEELTKRSRPSYQWQPDENGRWWRIWFREDNLTIQVDLHSENGDYEVNHYEFDVEQWGRPYEVLNDFYQMLGKQWTCPEMLWALMEMADEVSSYLKGRSLTYVFMGEDEPVQWKQ